MTTDKLTPHPDVLAGLARLAESRAADDQRWRQALARYACCGAPNLCGASCQDDEQSWLLARAERTIRGLEAECATLAEALDAVTHEFTPDPAGGSMCADGLGLYPARCAMTADHRIHRTSARVRAEQQQATT